MPFKEYRKVNYEILGRKKKSSYGFFISRDRYFINKMSNRIIAIENENFKCYGGNYDYYRKEALKKELDETMEIWMSYNEDEASERI